MYALGKADGVDDAGNVLLDGCELLALSGTMLFCRFASVSV